MSDLDRFLLVGETVDHDFDWESCFCKKCGVAMTTVCDEGVGCTDATNVTGISHLRAHARMTALVGDILGGREQ